MSDSGDGDRVEREVATRAWPDVPRVCFEAGEPWELNACVGWVQSRSDSMTGYIEGYRRAAEALFASAKATRQSPDYLVFPLAFLWRHNLELALKDIIVTGKRIARETPEIPGHHRLVQLWEAARPYIVECGDPKAPELTNVEANLVEFEKIDPGADGFRYPLARNGGANLTNAPSIVNLEALHEAMTALANFFEGVRGVLESHLDWVAEMEAEQRAEWSPDDP